MRRPSSTRCLRKPGNAPKPILSRICPDGQNATICPKCDVVLGPPVAPNTSRRRGLSQFSFEHERVFTGCRGEGWLLARLSGSFDSKKLLHWSTVRPRQRGNNLTVALALPVECQLPVRLYYSSSRSSFFLRHHEDTFFSRANVLHRNGQEHCLGDRASRQAWWSPRRRGYWSGQ
jgi:hypothetical protein